MKYLQKHATLAIKDTKKEKYNTIYFNKKQTGTTASVLINRMTVNYIKQMLLNSDKNIKQICTEAGFDKLSFFGKYVRRELGMSPRKFRQKGE